MSDRVCRCGREVIPEMAKSVRPPHSDHIHTDALCFLHADDVQVGTIKSGEEFSVPDVDLVNHPPHYTRGPKCDHCGKPIECINVVRNLSFNIGNAIKYLWRVGFGGKENDVQDLRKAGWYAEDEAKLRENETRFVRGES